MPDPFISTTDLSDFLGRDVTTDNGALIACDAACDLVRTASEQQFNKGTANLTLDGTGTDTLLLTELPVASAGTILVNGGTITDYMLNDNGILLRGTAGVVPRPVWPDGRQNINITYVYGYEPDDLPRDVRIVALSIAARLIVQGPALEESLGDQRIKYAAASTDLTNGEKMILRKYKPTR